MLTLIYSRTSFQVDKQIVKSIKQKISTFRSKSIWMRHQTKILNIHARKCHFQMYCRKRSIETVLDRADYCPTHPDLKDVHTNLFEWYCGSKRSRVSHTIDTSNNLLGRSVLGHSLGALRHCMLCQLSRKQKTYSSLDLAGGDGRPGESSEMSVGHSSITNNLLL